MLKELGNISTISFFQIADIIEPAEKGGSFTRNTVSWIAGKKSTGKTLQKHLISWALYSSGKFPFCEGRHFLATEYRPEALNIVMQNLENWLPVVSNTDQYLLELTKLLNFYKSKLIAVGLSQFFGRGQGVTCSLQICTTHWSPMNPNASATV